MTHVAALKELGAELEPVVRAYLFEQVPMARLAESLGLPVSTAWHRFRRGSEIYTRRLKELLSMSQVQRRGAT